MSGAIAYILKGFPRTSETFIANEVKLLAQRGLEIGLFSIKRGDALAAQDDLPAAVYAPSLTSLSGTTLAQWLRANVASFAPALRYVFRRRPLAASRTLVFAVRAAIRYRSSANGRLKKTFIKEYLLAVEFASEILRAARFRHLHAHFCHDATNVAWMVSQLTGLPFSFTAHAKDIYQGRQNPGDLLSRKLAAAKFVVTCTQANVQFLRDRCDDPQKVRCVYHGLDINLFKPEGRPMAASRPRLLAVGRHVEKKGFTYLIDACRALRDSGTDFQLNIVGETGPETARLQAQIRAAALDDCIVLHPPVRQKDLVPYYRAADIFVMPSVITDDGDRDGIPNVMAEAMAAGIPVIVSNISGIPELVDDGVNGLVVPPADSRAIELAIRRVLTDAMLGQRLGMAARLRVVNIFNAEETHSVLSELFCLWTSSNADLSSAN